MSKTYDVVVIGGGPAGSSSASNIAKQGYSVAVLEKAKMPRPQVGESLIPHFWKFADVMGVSEKIEAEGFIKKAGGTMYWGNQFRQFTFGDFGHTRAALHVERDRFDEILFRHAGSCGADLYEEAHALDADLSENGNTIKVRLKGEGRDVDFKCKALIDASGYGGFLGAKYKWRQMDPGFKYTALWGYFKNSKFVSMGGKVHPESSRKEIAPTTFVAELENDLGWGWNIILRNETSVGLLVKVEEVLKHKGSQEKFFLDMCKKTPFFAGLLSEAEFIPGSLNMRRDYSYASPAFAGPGWFMVGDAGAFADPIFSHGVHFSLFGGFQVGRAIGRALEGNWERATSNFERWIRQFYEFSRSLALPSYDPDAKVSAAVCDLLTRVSQRELELMYVASAMTDRSGNFIKMAKEMGIQAEANGIRFLPHLEHVGGGLFEPGTLQSAA